MNEMQNVYFHRYLKLVFLNFNPNVVSVWIYNLYFISIGVLSFPCLFLTTKLQCPVSQE